MGDMVQKIKELNDAIGGVSIRDSNSEDIETPNDNNNNDERGPIRPLQFRSNIIVALICLFLIYIIAPSWAIYITELGEKKIAFRKALGVSVLVGVLSFFIEMAYNSKYI